MHLGGVVFLQEVSFSTFRSNSSPQNWQTFLLLFFLDLKVDLIQKKPNTEKKNLFISSYKFNPFQFKRILQKKPWTDATPSFDI
jgi:hypothetical protein